MWISKADIKYNLCTFVGWVIYALSRVGLATKPWFSTCIGGWTTCGYCMDSNGFFRFPLDRLARRITERIAYGDK